jgi:hypothetical protein
MCDNGELTDVSIRRTPHLRNSLTIARHQSGYEDIAAQTGSGNEVVQFPIDLVRCSKILDSAMNPRKSIAYNLLTNLPFEYKQAPFWLRRIFLKSRRIDFDLSAHLAIDVAREKIRRSLEMLGVELQRKDQPIFIVTHDIESEGGLQRSLSLKAVEERLDMSSIWFLPSNEYPIKKAVAKDLAEGSIIGSHDVRHDGKLLHIQSREKLIRRLVQSRLRLTEIFGEQIRCFRSPLLQFKEGLLSALEEAGYDSDFSLPCWEPVYPMTMKGFGIQSTMRFRVGRVLEFPLTLFQDHQVLSVLGMNTQEAIGFWAVQAKLVDSIGGDMVLLIHPDYAFGRDTSKYRELLETLSEVRAVTQATDCMSTNQVAFSSGY